MKTKTLDRLTIIFMTMAFSLLLLYMIPFSWFVDIKSEAYSDVCVGDTKQVVVSERTPRWGIRGHVYAQVVKFEGQSIIETTIDRETEFGYEPNTAGSTYTVRWSEPFEEPGLYGVNSWVTISPLPLVRTTDFKEAEDYKFNVINCESINT